MGYIYGLWCACGCEPRVRYVGQTTQSLNTRLTNHRSMARFGIKTPVYNWIRKHSPDNIRIRGLEVVKDISALNAREIWWIANTPELLNLSPGGVIGDALRGTKRPDISEMMTGSAHYATHLTEDDVVEMRSWYTGKRGQIKEIAAKYDLTSSAASDIIRGVSWKHVPGAHPAQGKKRVRLTEEDVRNVRRRRSSGETLATIAADYETSETNIMYIVERRTWKHVE